MPETPETHPLPDRPDRVAELVAAAASGDLSATEAEEYAALVAADPTVAEETRALNAVLRRLDDAPGGWAEPEPSAELRARVLAVPETEGAPRTEGPPVTRAPVLGARRWWPAAAAAAVVLLLGGAWLLSGPDEEEPAAEGPPGTLGAVEQIDFEGEPAGVDIEAALVAHTWGTETVLRMDGFDPGDRYAVVLRATDGHLEDSGGFLGSPVEIDCRLNAALLREDVDAVEIRAPDGSVVARSDVPEVTG